MRRGELYRMTKGSPHDPRRSRVFVIASRQRLIHTSYSSVICAPVFSSRDGLSTEVPVGEDEGLKHECSIHCDQLMSLPKASLTDYVGSLSPAKMDELDAALMAALDLKPSAA